MKTKFLFIAILFIVLFTACSKNTAEVDPGQQDVGVVFTVVLEESALSQLKSYQRGDAPAYVSGLKITATNTLSYIDDISSTFDFVDFVDADGDGEHDGGGELMTMTVKGGENEFDAVSFAENSAFYQVVAPFDRLDVTSYPDPATRATAYAESFSIEAYPIFVEYSGNTTVTFDADTDAADVTLDMTADQGRVNIVFEGDEDVTYKITATEYMEDVSGSQVYQDNPLEIVLEDYTKVGACIFNTATMVSGSGVNVLIQFKPDGATDDEYKELTNTDVATVPGSNLTHLFYWDGIELVDIGFTVDFTPITDESDYTEIE